MSGAGILVACLAWVVALPAAYAGALDYSPRSTVEYGTTHQSFLAFPGVDQALADAMPALDGGDRTLLTETLSGSPFELQGDILDIQSVFFGSEREWRGEPRWPVDSPRSERQRGGTALELIRSYVNRIDSPSMPGSTRGSYVPWAGSAPSRGQSEDAGGNGSGGGESTLLSIARSIADPETLDLIKQALRPERNGALVSFSLFGVGEFVILGDQNSGAISVLDVTSGRSLDLRSGQYGRRAESAPADNPAAAAPAPPPRRILSAEPTSLGHIVRELRNLALNPLAIITYFCALAIWLLWRVLKRFA